MGETKANKVIRKWISFELARTGVHLLELKNVLEWREWSKSGKRPRDIPAAPDKVYAHQGWVDWGDWLGTESIATHKKEYLSLQGAKKYIQALGIKNTTEWRAFLKSGKRPDNIPTKPHITYKYKGWKGWGDFFGAGKVKRGDWRPFEKARTFVKSLSFKNQSDWFNYTKEANFPNDIPCYPNEVYVDQGWISWGDWLGTGYVAPQNREYLSFEDARSVVHSLGLKNNKEWRDWSRDYRLNNIPSAPDKTYANNGWVGWGDWLGTGSIACMERKFKSYEEAAHFAQSRGIKSKNDWFIWIKDNARPEDIPSNPSKAYADSGWKGWGDFLGTGIEAHFLKKFRSFEDARVFARSLKLEGKEAWSKWTKSSKRPYDIPTAPDRTYADKGWINWADWLDCKIKWTVENIRLFISSILLYIETLNEVELYVLCQQNGLLATQAKGKAFVQAFKTGKFPKEELEKFAKNEPSLVEEFFDDANKTLDSENGDIQSLSHIVAEEGIDCDEAELNIVETKNILESLGGTVFANLDKEAVDFFIKSAVAKVWKHALTSEDAALEQLKKYKIDNVYAQEVRQQFLRDYEASKNLRVPVGYAFAHKPNLMQRYSAYLIKSRKRVGNWCGTGAGKTLSAILASRVINASLTVICCPNNIIDNWIIRIEETYPDSLVFSKSNGLNKIKSSADASQYLILNYEFFQQPQAEFLLSKFVAEKNIDFVVIDEIHYSKQREQKTITQRKKVLEAFLSEASTKNRNLHVLGMSATPVINNLYEGKTLIELVTGVRHDEMNTTSTVSNCITLYQKLISHGIRWVPRYSAKMNLQVEDIDCSTYVPEVKETGTQSMINMEGILVRVKTSYILKNLKPKTIIYSHYKKNILEPLRTAVENQGWKVAVFNGDDKSGLHHFIEGDADVLIASSCVGTGVDGLQYVCNRLIVACLPWTHAEFEQLKGRIYRQGQKEDVVDVLVPLTFAEVKGERWSWCQSRWKRILFKKTIGDAAVDGVIPEGHLRTPAQAFKDSKRWLDRLDRNEVYETERQPLNAQLDDKNSQKAIRRIGDLTRMNQKINTVSSNETHQRFASNPDQWHGYHAAYREKRKGWGVVPYEEATKWVQKRPNRVVADFGCGEALLSASVSNLVHSFDHIAINDSVIACDMAHVPLENNSIDAAIFSLSLMGTNYVDYLREARRCLKLDGQIWIAEPTDRIKDMDSFKELLERLGFDIRRVQKKWKFTLVEAFKSDREICEEALKLLDQKILD